MPKDPSQLSSPVIPGPLHWLTPANLLALGVALVCLVTHYTGLTEALRFDRNAIDAGQVWRLLTGNFVHMSDGHLWMNLAGLLLVAILVWGRFGAAQWLFIIVLSSLAVCTGLYYRDPHIIWYVGFSGTLHGLLIAGTLADLPHYPRSAGVLLVLVLGKLGWEQFAGALPGSESMAGGSVVVNSHLYGALGGLLGASILLGWQWVCGRRTRLWR